MRGPVAQYDPSIGLGYDPNVSLNFEGGGLTEVYIAQNASQYAKVDIVLTNGSTSTGGQIDIFNNLSSSTKVEDTTIKNNGGAFQTDGSLLFGSGTDSVSVSCASNISYRSLFDALGINAIRVRIVRLVVTATAQLNASLTTKRKTFLGGQKENSIQPNTFLTPDQMQNDRVDIPMLQVVDAEVGWFYTLDATPSSVVTMSCFIDAYVKNYSGGAILK